MLLICKIDAKEILMIKLCSKALEKSFIYIYSYLKRVSTSVSISYIN